MLGEALKYRSTSGDGYSRPDGVSGGDRLVPKAAKVVESDSSSSGIARPYCSGRRNPRTTTRIDIHQTVSGDGVCGEFVRDQPFLARPAQQVDFACACCGISSREPAVASALGSKIHLGAFSGSSLAQISCRSLRRYLYLGFLALVARI